MRPFLRGILVTLAHALACAGCTAGAAKDEGYSNNDRTYIAPVVRAGEAGIEELNQRRRPK